MQRDAWGIIDKKNNNLKRINKGGDQIGEFVSLIHKANVSTAEPAPAKLQTRWWTQNYL